MGGGCDGELERGGGGCDDARGAGLPIGGGWEDVPGRANAVGESGAPLGRRARVGASV